MSKKINHFFFAIVCILLAIIIITSKIDFNDGLIVHGDYTFPINLNKNIFDTATTWSENYFGENQTNNIFLYFPESFIQYLFGTLFPLNIAAYLYFILPIFFVSIISYLFFSRLSDSWVFGLLSSLFLLVNNLASEYFIFGGNYFYFAEIALLLLLNEIMVKKRDTLSVKQIIRIALFSLLSYHLFFLFVYILTLIIISIYNNKKNLNRIIFVVLLILLLNCFIVLPFIQGSLDRPPTETYLAVNLDNVLKGFVETTSYLYHTSVYHYFDFVAANLFSSYNQLFYILLLLISIFTILILNKNKLVLLSSILFLAFFIFSLGPVGVITGKIFEYMFNTVPFFGFFRSFPRFLIIIPLTYLIFVSLFYKKIKYNKNLSNIFLILLGILILLSHFAVVSGDYNGYVKAYSIPDEYFNLDKIFQNDYQQFSILSLPTNDYENYSWTTPNSSDFRQSYYIMDGLFSKPVIFDRASLQLHTKNITFETMFSQNCPKDFNTILKKTNIKYILVNKDKTNVFSKTLLDYNKINDCILKFSDINKIQENDYFILYKLQNSEQIILSDAPYNFKRINSTKYIINLKIWPDKNNNLIFLQNFNSNFKLFLNPYKIKKTQDFNLLQNEIIYNTQFFEGGEINYLLENSIFDNTHKKIYEYANNWQLDVNYIKSNFPDKYYGLNPDGSINIQVVLYFKLQSYFYLGLIISGLTLIVCLFYLFYNWRRNRAYFKVWNIKFNELDKKQEKEYKLRIIGLHKHEQEKAGLDSWSLKLEKMYWLIAGQRLSDFNKLIENKTSEVYETIKEKIIVKKNKLKHNINNFKIKL